VFNFLTEPLLALREIYRVLVPGGTLLVSYYPVPSLATLQDDLRKQLAAVRPPGFRPITLSRSETTLPRRRRFDGQIREVGLLREREYVTGLEDSRFGRWLRVEMLLPLSELASRFDLLPHRFVVARKPGSGSGASPPADVLSCPRCRADLPMTNGPLALPILCDSCGAQFPAISGTVDFR